MRIKRFLDGVEITSSEVIAVAYLFRAFAPLQCICARIVCNIGVADKSFYLQTKCVSNGEKISSCLGTDTTGLTVGGLSRYVVE